MSRKVLCPKCLGSGQPMTAKKDVGFEYKKCNICEGTGEVTPELEEDFILSLNEDNINEEEIY